MPHGRVLGVDIDRAGLAAARGDATTIGCGNLAFAAADGRQLPFRSGVFDAVLCHSMLETLNDPTSVVREMRRVMKRGGIVGAASVEYGGIILGGAKTTDPQRFYDIRQQVWRAEGIAEPNTGRRLRGLFQEAGFSRVEASAHYICYGTPDRIIAFAHDRAAECRNQRLQATVARHGIAPVEELTRLAASWEGTHVQRAIVQYATKIELVMDRDSKLANRRDAWLEPARLVNGPEPDVDESEPAP